MPMIIATGQCKDAKRWEKGFRSHADLFRLQSVVSPIQFSVNDNNYFAILFEAEDLEKYQDILESDATADALASDGVVFDSIKVFLLDRELDINLPPA